jgi:hypothetical protein
VVTDPPQPPAGLSFQYVVRVLRTLPFAEIERLFPRAMIRLVPDQTAGRQSTAQFVVTDPPQPPAGLSFPYVVLVRRTLPFAGAEARKFPSNQILSDGVKFKLGVYLLLSDLARSQPEG